MNIQPYKTKDGSKRYILKGAYIGVDSLTGEQVRTTIRGKSEREVRRKYEAKIQEFEDNGYSVQQKITIKNGNELIDLWLDYYIDSGIRPSTYKAINAMINKHIRPLIGNCKISELTSRLMGIKVNQFKKNIKGKLKAYNTPLSFMRTILQYGVEQEYLKSNPMANIKTGKDKKDKSLSKKEKKLKYYNKEQISHILNAFQPYFESENLSDTALATYIKILLLTGARANEILALNWSDIDFNKKTMIINETISNKGKNIEPPKSDAGIRKIEIDDITIATLKQWQRLLFEKCLKFGLKRPNYIFYNINNKRGFSGDSFLGNYRYDNFLSKYQDFCIDNNIPYLKGLHCFRHTHATMYVASGGDFKTLQVRLGHEDIRMTMNLYAQALPEVERNALENAISFMTT